METNLLDIVVLVIIVLSAVRGFLRGLSRELADLFRAVGAVLAACFLYEPLGLLIFEKTRLSDIAAAITAFILILLLAFLIFTMIHYFLSKFMQFAFKGPLERIGGLLSGLLKGCVFAAVFVALLSIWPHDAFRKAVREGSMCGRWIVSQYPPLHRRISERYPIINDFQASLTNNVPSIIRDDQDSENLEPDEFESEEEQQGRL